MVSTEEALESKYITAETVKNSPTKKLVITGEGNYEEVTYENETSRRLTLPVDIDGKPKTWRPNRDSITNLKNTYGADTKTWIGKIARLQIIRIQGKDSIIATPQTTEA